MAFADDFVAPPGFQTDEFLIRPLTVADNALDYAAVMESREFLRLWEGSTWPEDDFTLEANMADMEKMEKRHNEGDTYGYTVMNPTQSECLGCLYIAPPVFRWFDDLEITPVGNEQWTDYDVVISFWIRKSRLIDGLDRRVLEALGPWFTNEWGLDRQLFQTNETFEQQVAMLQASDLKHQFRTTDPEDGAVSLVFG